MTPTGQRTQQPVSSVVLGLALPLLTLRRLDRHASGSVDSPAGARTSPAPDAQRARNRLAAFVYGNVTLLAAVLTTTAAMSDDGRAPALVAAAALTTFVGHALADLFASRMTTEKHHGLRDELRDALPIATAAAVPLSLFCLSWRHLLPAVAAQAGATIVIVLRLATTGLVVGHLYGRRPTAATVRTGAALATAGTALAIAKVQFLH